MPFCVENYIHHRIITLLFICSRRAAVQKYFGLCDLRSAPQIVYTSVSVINHSSLYRAQGSGSVLMYRIRIRTYLCIMLYHIMYTCGCGPTMYAYT